MKASALRREIIGIKQHKGEAFHIYWERFKKLCARCPKHGITEYQLLQYFIEGMTRMERWLFNASSGGSLPEKIPTEICNLIKNMAEDSKHSSHDEEWYTVAPRGVKEYQTPQIEAQISELTKVVMMLAKDNGMQPTPRPCDICTQVGHPTDMCPQLQEEDYEEENALGGPPFQPQNFQLRQPQPPPPQTDSSIMSLEDIVKILGTSTQSFQQEPKANIKSLEKQVPQLDQSVSRMESQGKLSSQIEKKPQHNACAITLRGGKDMKAQEIQMEKRKK
ncbi:hypothetical protein Lser_V15G01502 [Lactuca serriola]